MVWPEQHRGLYSAVVSYQQSLRAAPEQSVRSKLRDRRVGARTVSLLAIIVVRRLPAAHAQQLGRCMQAKKIQPPDLARREGTCVRR